MRKKGKKNTPIHLPQNLKDQISESYANVGDEDGHYRIAKPTSASHFTQNRRLERKKKKLDKKNKKKLSHEFKMAKYTGSKTREPEPIEQVEKKRKLSSIQIEDPYKQSVKKLKVEKSSNDEVSKNKIPQKQQKQISKDDRNANFMKLLQTDGLIPRNKGEKVVYPEDQEIEFYTKMLKKTAKKKDSFLENILKPTNKDSSDVSEDEGEEGDYEEENFGSEEEEEDGDDFLNQNSEDEDDDDVDENEEQYLSDEDNDQSEEEKDNKKSHSKDSKTSSSDKKWNKEEKSATQERVSKYIPPHLRQKQVGQNKNSGEITKTVRGILNRASEANLSLVVTQIQELFDSHPRNGT